MTGDLTKQTSNRLIRAGLIFFLFLLIIIPSSGFANWGGGDDSEPKQTNFEKGITEIEAKNYKKAVKYQKKQLKKTRTMPIYITCLDTATGRWESTTIHSSTIQRHWNLSPRTWMQMSILGSYISKQTGPQKQMNTCKYWQILVTLHANSTNN